MAALSKTVPRPMTETVLCCANALMTAKQRNGMDWSEVHRVVQCLHNVPVNLMDENQQETATQMAIYAASHDQWEAQTMRGFMRDIIDSWIEKAGYINTNWQNVVDALDQYVSTEAVDELSHLDDFLGYDNLLQIDEDIHYAQKKFLHPKVKERPRPHSVTSFNMG